jgi:zinc protease
MTSPRHTLLTLLLAGLATASIIAPAHAQNAGTVPGSQNILPLDPATTHGVLPNGLTYYIRPNRKPEKRAELRLIVRAGSILEDPEQQGLAHFCEHMAFNGTKNFKKQELINYLESIGVKFGPHLNAYTSFDETVYMLQVPTDSAKQLETAFQILEDWAHNVSFDDAEIDKERGVVREEWRLRRGAWARMNDETFPILYKGSRYAERLPIGRKEVIDTFHYDAVRRFYRDWYRPELMAVVAVGDFDRERIEAIIREKFSRIPASEHPRDRAWFPVPDQEGTLTAIAHDKEATMANVQISYKHPRSGYRTEADFRSRLVERLFSGMLGSRLDELRSRGEAPFAFAFAYKGSNTPTKDMFVISAFTPEEKTLRALETIATEAERVRRYGFVAGELDRQKQEMIRSLEQQYNERDTTGSDRMVWSYVGHFLQNGFLTGIETEYKLSQQMLPDITLEDVNRLSTTLITRQNRVVLVQAPDRDGVKVPDGSEQLGVLAKIEAGEIARYDDAVSDGPLVVPPAAKGTIVSESRNQKLGTVDWKLSNGVRVILKPTDFKNDEIEFRAISPGGNSLVSDAEYDAISSASGIIGEGGLGTFDLTTLNKKLAGKVANSYAYIGELYEGLRGDASPKDIETLMQLIYLQFTAPRMDPKGFEAYRTLMSTFAKNSSLSPEGAMSDTVQVTLAGYHPRRRPFSQATIDAMDLKKSYDFYRDRFADAGDFTFIFVGNIDPERARPLVLSYLGNLPSKGRKENWRDVGVHFPKGAIEKSVTMGIEPKSVVRMVFTGAFEWNEANRKSMNATVGVLNIMLREILREEKGGTYSVSVRAMPTLYPRPEYSINVSFGCAPERVDELTKAAMATLDSLKRFGPSRINLGKVKEQARRQRETDLKENDFWADSFEEMLRNNEALDSTPGEEKVIDDVTPESVKEGANRWFDMNNYVRVVLYPKTQMAGSEK